MSAHGKTLDMNRGKMNPLQPKPAKAKPFEAPDRDRSLRGKARRLARKARQRAER